MKKSAFISDILLTFFLVSVFTLCLFRHFRISLGVAIFLSTLCGVLGSAAVAAFLQNKRKTFFLKKSDEAQKQKLLLHLALLSDEKKTQFFLPILAKETTAKRFGKTYIHTPDAFYNVKVGFSAVTAEDVANFYRLRSNKNKILLCSQIEEKALLLCQQLNIQIKSGNEIYKFAKDNDALPTKFLGENNSQERRKKQWRLCCSKKNGKRFLISGALILFTSLYTPFAYYYLIFGSILLLVALFIRIFGYE